MQYYFDPAQRTFYCDEVHSDIPSGSIPLSGEEEHQKLVAALNDRKMISVVKGKLVVGEVKSDLTALTAYALAGLDSISNVAVNGMFSAMEVNGIPASMWRLMTPKERDAYAEAFGTTVSELNGVQSKKWDAALANTVVVHQNKAACLKLLPTLKTPEAIQSLIDNFEQEVTKVCSNI